MWISNKTKYLLLFFVIVLVIGSIWVLPARYYLLHFATVTDESMEAARVQPNDTVLKQSIVIADHISPDNNTAQEILSGQVDDPFLGRRKLQLPFSVYDVTQGSDAWLFTYASLSMPNVLLREYEATGDRQYLLLAKDMVYHFLLWEKTLLTPKGFIWNDHALSNQLIVLARLWSHYRSDQDYDQLVAKEFLQGVQRISTRLASPYWFTYNTNHGIMQNLALLESSIAFPSLPNAAKWGNVAKSRLQQQLKFYQSPEGVILEHSPHYHEFGLRLLTTAVDLRRLSGDADASWGNLLQAGRLIGQWLTRPDDSLPVFGDTSAGPPVAAHGFVNANNIGEGGGPPSMERFAVYPVAGLGGWHTLSPVGKLVAHATANWGYFQWNGHTRADQLSLSLWLSGLPELVNAGYWPESLDGRQEALGWRGSNAPHFIGEQALPARPAPELLAFSDTEPLRGLVMLRESAQGTVQRQFFQLGNGFWIVLDIFASSSNPEGGEVIWRVNGQLPSDTGGYRSLTWDGDAGQVLSARFIGADSAKPCPDRLAYAVVSSRIVPVSCVALETGPAPAAILSLWSASGARPATPGELNFQSASDWEISGIGDKVWTRLMRKDDTLTLYRGDGGQPLAIALTPAPDVSKERLDIQLANVNLKKLYPKYQNLDYYRVRLTYLCLGLALMQLLAVALIARYFPKLRHGLVVLSGVAWVMLGVYMNAVYLVK